MTFTGFQKWQKSGAQGFTLVELLVVIALTVIIFLMNFTFNAYLLVDSTLDSKAHEIVENLKLAQTRSMARYQDSQWGVYFNNVGSPQQFIVFKGNTYAARDASYDLVTNLPSSLSFTTLTFTGGGSEVDFAKLSGNTTQSGTIVLTSNQNHTRTITISTLGVVDIN